MVMLTPAGPVWGSMSQASKIHTCGAGKGAANVRGFLKLSFSPPKKTRKLIKKNPRSTGRVIAFSDDRAIHRYTWGRRQDGNQSGNQTTQPGPDYYSRLAPSLKDVLCSSPDRNDIAIFN